MTAALKPCLFCGAEAVMYRVDEYIPERIRARCRPCGAEGPVRKTAAAVDAWNRRVPDPALAAEARAEKAERGERKTVEELLRHRDSFVVETGALKAELADMHVLLDGRTEEVIRANDRHAIAKAALAAAEARAEKAEAALREVAARAREAAQTLRAVTPDANAGPTNVDEYARRAARHIERLAEALREALADLDRADEANCRWGQPIDISAARSTLVKALAPTTTEGGAE